VPDSGQACETARGIRVNQASHADVRSPKEQRFLLKKIDIENALVCQESPSGDSGCRGRVYRMKHLLGTGDAPILSADTEPARAVEASCGIPEARGPIEFRFVLKFAAQMSTPCSRGLSIKPRAGRAPVRRAPRMFQSYLQRHSVLQ
jgi:hypothetical protein